MVRRCIVIHRIDQALLLLLLVLFLAGCETAQETATKEAPKKPLAGDQVSLLVSWTQLGAAEHIAKWYFEETGTVVHIIKSEYHDLLETTRKDYSSAIPQVDVLMLWYVHLGRLAEEGILIPLNDFYKENSDTLQIDDLIPHFFTNYALYKDRYWAVPFDGDTHVLFYRKSIFEKYGLQPPATWEEYLQTSRLITEKEQQNNIFGSAIIAEKTPILIISSFMNRLGGFGGSLYDQHQQLTVNSTEAIEALTAMVEQARYALPTPLETDFAIARDAFLQGRVAMVEQWTDIGIMAEDPTQSQIMGDWGVVPIPSSERIDRQGVAALNAGWALGISARAPHPEAAEKLLAFIGRPDITLRLNLIPGGGGIDPTRLSVLKNEEFQKLAPQVSAVERTLLDSQVISWPNHPEAPTFFNLLSDAIVSALEGRVSPEEALVECQKRWEMERSIQ